jgi:hypothetical protein
MSVRGLSGNPERALCTFMEAEVLVAAFGLDGLRLTMMLPMSVRAKPCLIDMVDIPKSDTGLMIGAAPEDVDGLTKILGRH